MATWQMTNVLTGGTDQRKFNAEGETTEIWSVALTTALANGDTINGPWIPANCYLANVTVDVDQLDSNGTPLISFECGYTGHLAAFIATGNTTARTGGTAQANVNGTVGFTQTTDIQVLVTITAAAATAKAGTMRLLLEYTASP